MGLGAVDHLGNGVEHLDDFRVDLHQWQGIRQGVRGLSTGAIDGEGDTPVLPHLTDLVPTVPYPEPRTEAETYVRHMTEPVLNAGLIAAGGAHAVRNIRAGHANIARMGENRANLVRRAEGSHPASVEGLGAEAAETIRMATDKAAERADIPKEMRDAWHVVVDPDASIVGTANDAVTRLEAAPDQPGKVRLVTHVRPEALTTETLPSGVERFSPAELARTMVHEARHARTIWEAGGKDATWRQRTMGAASAGRGFISRIEEWRATRAERGATPPTAEEAAAIRDRVRRAAEAQAHTAAAGPQFMGAAEQAAAEHVRPENMPYLGGAEQAGAAAPAPTAERAGGVQQAQWSGLHRTISPERKALNARERKTLDGSLAKVALGQRVPALRGMRQDHLEYLAARGVAVGPDGMLVASERPPAPAAGIGGFRLTPEEEAADRAEAERAAGATIGHDDERVGRKNFCGLGHEHYAGKHDDLRL